MTLSGFSVSPLESPASATELPGTDPKVYSSSLLKTLKDPRFMPKKNSVSGGPPSSCLGAVVSGKPQIKGLLATLGIT